MVQGFPLHIRAQAPLKHEPWCRVSPCTSRLLIIKKDALMRPFLFLQLYPEGGALPYLRLLHEDMSLVVLLDDTLRQR